MSELSSIRIHQDMRLREVRDGYLSGWTDYFGKRFEVEAFRVVPGGWNESNGKRGSRMYEVIHGLVIDDVPLNQVEIPGYDGLWILVVYPAENQAYTGERQ